MSALEFCRDCRDEREWLAPGVPADFILWGKLFPPEAFGPKCLDHASKWFDVHRVEQYAVFDLRPVRAAVEIAERHADGWHPQFHTDPAKCVWVPWNEGDPEPFTSEQVEWYRKRREARQ